MSEVRKYPHGHIFNDPPVIAEPMDEDWEHKLDVGSVEMIEEIRSIKIETNLLTHQPEDENE